MKKPDRTMLRLAILLIGISVALYALLFLTFGRLSDIEFYTLMDVAFIPIEVLIVGVVINRLLAVREKRAMLDKLNMVIGAFFSEVGRELLHRLAAFDADCDRVRPYMQLRQTWTDKDFDAAVRGLQDAHPAVDILNGDPVPLRDFLTAKRPFMLGLLENPNLLEHDRFTDMLWAVTHLSEELAFRPGFDELPVPDLAHLSLDMRRAYVALLSEWLEHARHLKTAYPYLYSLAVRTNPLDPAASVEVTE